jgi:uncharacterized membrane protein
MNAEVLNKIVDSVARGVELGGVAVIGVAYIHATIRGLVEFGQRRPDAFQRMRVYVGKALQLGLEFLVAADIINTVTVTPTRDGLLLLGFLIVLRTFLSWSITVEIDGCWPWQVAKNSRG